MLQKLIFYLRHSLNDLRVNKQRTFFALLCIAAGVGAIVSLQTLGVMIKDTLTGSIQESNRGDLRILPFNWEANDTERQRGQNEGILGTADSPEASLFPESGMQKLEAWLQREFPDDIDTISYRQSNTNAAGIAVSHPENDTLNALTMNFIVDASVYPLYGEVRSNDGKVLKDMLKNPTDIVLSENLADTLEAKVGDKVRLSQVEGEFTVQGIVPTRTEGGLENFGAGILGYYYVDISALPLFDDMEVAGGVLFVRLNHPEKVDEISQAIKDRYPYLNTVTTTDLEKANTTISDSVTQLITIMGLVSLLIGGIGIVNTMLVIVSRRTTEVAVLKTIGLEAEQVTILFMVEAALMGLLGSLMGVVLGWGLTFVVKGVAEAFIAETLSFRITPQPVFTGIVVGVLVSTIFGFMPTLAAGQVRPAYVLRPSESFVPKAGRLRSFVALLVVLFALSALTQGLLNGLLSPDITVGDVADDSAESQLEENPTAEVTTAEDMGAAADIKIFRMVAGIGGLILGIIMAVPMLIGGIFYYMTGGHILLRILRWFVIIFLLPIGTFIYAYIVPAVLVMTLTFILMGLLYLTLMLLIWAVGGGRIEEFPVLGNFPPILRLISFLFFPAWTALLVFVMMTVESNNTRALFAGLLFFIHIPAIMITVVLPGWVLGYLIQRFGFLDIKISLRSMVSARGRGASTLLALVVGVFTLSVMTMLVDTLTDSVEKLLVDVTGGNVIILAASDLEDTFEQIDMVLSDLEGMHSYAIVELYSTEFYALEDVSEGQTLNRNEIDRRIRANTGETQDEDNLIDDFDSVTEAIDGRDLESNLPDFKFYDGRQLTLDDEDTNYIIMAANDGTIAADIEVGDRVTFQLLPGDGEGSISGVEPGLVTFEVAGLTDQRADVETISAPAYAPRGAFPDDVRPDIVYAVVDIDENHVKELRRGINEIPGTFVLETRLLNDLFNRIVDQFTAFPTLVAALALFTGGIVIANSVALSTLERRREIAIMKAVGLQRERVLGMLLLENGLMGFIGGLIGVGMASLILLLMLVAMFEGELGTAIPYVTAFLLMGLCIVIALVAAILTAWGASGEKPLNVLRYE